MPKATFSLYQTQITNSIDDGGSIMSGGEGSYQFHHDLIPEIEHVLAQHRIFVRKARDNAQKMLFFFGLCLKTEKPDINREIIDTYRDFARTRIMDLTFWPENHASAVYALLDQLGEREDADWMTAKQVVLSEDEQIDPWLDEISQKQIKVKQKVNQYPVRADLTELFDCHKELTRWKHVVEMGPLLENSWKKAENYDRDWSEARERVEDFLAFEGSTVLHRFVLKISSRSSLLWKAAQWLRNFSGGIRKNLAMLIASSIGLFVILKVEAVNSLIRNMDAWAIIPFGLALFPLLLNKSVIWSRYAKRHIVPSWDVGGIPHRSWRYLATEPGRFSERWPGLPAAAGSGVLDVQALYRNVGNAFLSLWSRLIKPESILDLIVRGQIVRTLYYLLAWILGLFILLMFVHLKLVDSTYLTVFLIVVILYTVILVSRLIDFWDFLEPKPMRYYLLLYAAIGIYALLKEWGRQFFIAAFLGWSIWFFWTFLRRPGRPLRFVLAVLLLGVSLALAIGGKTLREAAWQASDEKSPWRSEIVWPLPGSGPVVVMAASGGGSRAALYTALTLKKLKEMHVACPDGGPPECALSDYIQAISSVSGGSLANAGYVARRLSGNSQTNLMDLPEAVSEDFILPTLWGALYPLISRGDAIEAKWQGLDELVRSCSNGGLRVPKENPPIRSTAGMALGAICLSDVAQAWRQAVKDGAALAPVPMPIFNTSTLDGHDVVISPLPKEYYISSDVGAEARDLKEQNLYGKYPSSAWVYYRDGIYGLEDLMGASFDPLLSSAVRASANFPFGFPLVELGTTRPLFLHPDWTRRCKGPDPNVCEQKSVYLTDGGALSNSGMWSLFRLLMNQADKGLAKRGVLLVIVDASKMAEPEDPDRTILGLQSTLSSQPPIGQYLHRSMFDLLGATYGHGIAVTQIDLDPQRKNIHTTWAFDPGTRNELQDIFEGRWSKIKGSLVDRWQYLYARSKSENPQAYELPNGLELIDRERPPVD